MATNVFTKPPNIVLAMMHDASIVGCRDGVYVTADQKVVNVTQAQLDTQEAVIKAQWDKDYVNRRIREYPKIGDQLDDLYRKGAFSDSMAASLKAVKDKYPKS